jgi:hypothetical protein
MTTLTGGEIAKLARKVEDFRPFQVITILPQGKPNPKRQDAKRRFSLYEDGMTVAEYAKVRERNPGPHKPTAMDDMKWDYVRRYIDVK